MASELLKQLSLWYLSLPVCIFVFGYCRWPVTIIVCMLLGAALYPSCRPLFFHSPHSLFQTIFFHKRHLQYIAFTACVLLLLSGVGGYGSQDGDWYKHNAILSALIRHDWPAAYTFKIPNNQLAIAKTITLTNVPLIYYMAYYLPAAIVGKLFGWFWANQALFLWTFLGLCLSIAWFLLLIQRISVGALCLFAAFSGLDAFGIAVLRLFFLGESLNIPDWYHIERWAGHWEYPSHVTSLFWAPGQGICAWIVSGLMMQALLSEKPKHVVIFLLSLTAFWSPFVSLGIVPFILADFLCDHQPVFKRLRLYFSTANLCGLVILIMFGLFYLSKFFPSPVPFIPVEAGVIFSSQIFPGLFWHEIALLIVLFCLMEYGIFALLIWRSRLPLMAVERQIFVVSVGILSLLPFFRYGFWNDLVMRTSLPALFFIAVFTARALYAKSTSVKIRWLIAIALILGSVNVFVEFNRHMKETRLLGKLYTLPTQYVLYDIPHTNITPSFFTQYIGSVDSPFFQYLAKPPMPSPPDEILSVTTTKRTP